ncbi:histone deacetylase 1/2 [Cryptococcus deuterogattii 2001/935-1]|nr:histone deacetylase 1/2 [Cryptococcus deuterogattii 2001/935-1]
MPFSVATYPPLDFSSVRSDGRRVAYYYDHDVGNYHFGLGHPMKPHRIRMTHNLVVNYGLADDPETMEDEGRRKVNAQMGMENDEARWVNAELRGSRGKRMQIFRPRRATKTDMTRFHTDEYIELLESVLPENVDALTGNGSRGLTGSDCPAVEGIFEFSSISAGGSIGAAEKLNEGAADIAINWAGGLHHAKKTEASGFCYVNDIVLGILELLRVNSRVLYIDIDVHHGDGVEEAFYSTDRVMTCSFHLFGNFFPGTGALKDTGLGKGKGYAVNVPLREGITDEGFHSIFKPVIAEIMEHYRPSVIVLQGGADSMSGDKLGRLNLSDKGHAECARFLRTFNVPLMLLGGGGYTTKNVARAWTRETAIACGQELSEDLPSNQYMEYYGPRYKLEVLPSNVEDFNTPEYLDDLKRQISNHLKNLPFAPSAQMRQVTGRNVSQAVGLSNGWETDDPGDQIDQRLKILFASKNFNGTYTQESDTSLNDLTSASRIRRQGGFKTLPRSSVVFDRARKRYFEEDVGMEEDPCCHLPAMIGKGKNRKSAMSESLTPPTSAPEWRSHLSVHEMRKRPHLAETLQQLSPGSEDECDRNRRITENSQLHMIGQLRRKRSFFLS